MKKSILVTCFFTVCMAIVLSCTYGCVQDETSDDIGHKQQVTLQIFSANALEKAMPEVQALYTQKHPNVHFADTQFRASGDLRNSLKAGAPADIFITASQAEMQKAKKEDLVLSDTAMPLFTNHLIVCAKKDSQIHISSLKDLEQITGKIAIGDPATMPAPKYANQAMYKLGMYTNASGEGGSYTDHLDQKFYVVDKVGTACKLVSTGDCSVGFVFSSDIYRYNGIKEIYAVPDADHAQIIFPGAVTKSSQHSEVARDFLNFCVNDPEAQKIWSKYGFEVATNKQQ